MANFNPFDMDHKARALTHADKALHRKNLRKRGICTNCELIQTHKVTFLGHRVPLTNDVVENGKCLVCHAGRRASGSSTMTSSVAQVQQAQQPPHREVSFHTQESNSNSNSNNNSSQIMTLNSSSTTETALYMEESPHGIELARIEADDNNATSACSPPHDLDAIAQHLLTQTSSAVLTDVTTSTTTAFKNNEEEAALDFLAHLSDVRDVLQCMDVSISIGADQAIVVKECIRWLSNYMSERIDIDNAASEIMSVDTFFGTLLDVMENQHYISNASILIPALKLINRLLVLSMDDGDDGQQLLSSAVRHLSVVNKGTTVVTAVHIIEIGGLDLSRKIMYEHVQNIDVMKLTCEMLSNFCIACCNDHSMKRATASKFVNDGMVQSLQYILEEQADPEVLAHVVDVIFFVIQSSDKGKRELRRYNGATALQQAIFICEGHADLQHKLKKVLQLL